MSGPMELLSLYGEIRKVQRWKEPAAAKLSKRVRPMLPGFNIFMKSNTLLQI